MNAREILEQAVREDVSDIFIVAGLPVSCRKNGNIIQTQEEKLFPKETEALLNEIYGMAGDRDMMNLLVHGDDDFSFAIPGVSRFRVSAYKQRGALSAVIRVITRPTKSFSISSVITPSSCGCKISFNFCDKY